MLDNKDITKDKILFTLERLIRKITFMNSNDFENLKKDGLSIKISHWVDPELSHSLSIKVEEPLE